MTQWMLLFGTFLLASGAPAVAVQAQTCLGGPDLSRTPKVLATSAAGTDLGRTMVARYGVTGERIFAAGQVGVGGNAFTNLRAPIIGGDLGLVVPIGAGGTTQLCPVLQSLYQHGPNPTSGYTARSARSSLGLSLGRAIGLWSSVAVVPFLQGNLLHLYMTNSTPATDGFPSGLDIRTSKLYGEVGAGFGLRVNDLLTITPSYRIPVMAGDASTQYHVTSTRPSNSRFGVYQQQYSLAVSFGFGR